MVKSVFSHLVNNVELPSDSNGTRYVEPRWFPSNDARPFCGIPPARCASNPYSFKSVGRIGEVDIMVDRRYQSVLTLRYLLSKVVYERKVDLGDWLAISFLYGDIWLKLDRDDLLRKKYESAFAISYPLLESVMKTSIWPCYLQEDCQDLSPEVYPLLLSKRAFFGLRSQRRGPPAITFRIRADFHLPKHHKRYMGVGYRDKGNRRDLAFDGSPHWSSIFPFLVDWDNEANQELERNRPRPSPPLWGSFGPGR